MFFQLKVVDVEWIQSLLQLNNQNQKLRYVAIFTLQ